MGNFTKIEQGFIAMEYPQSPNHPKQRYFLTEKGKSIKWSKNASY
ncbi:hypothetical protein FACS1894201_10740 [Bacteroidia bacterium]|nr:hypothetical protein FACS1894201_10740 [Bacteroidia bacterium]